MPCTREERILSILRQLTAIPSVSQTPSEKLAGQTIEELFEGLPYFKAHPGQTGAHVLPGDSLGRTIPYALLRGESARTLVLMGHYDVVETTSYGNLEPVACLPD